MNKISERRVYIYIIMLLIMQLISLYVIKYLNQDLELSEFSPVNIGNLFNLLIYAGIMSGIYFSYRKNKNIIPTKIILIFIVSCWLLLIAAFSSTKIMIFSDSAYAFNLPGDRLLTAILFLSYLSILIYFLILLWSKIFFQQKVSAGRNIINTIIAFIIFAVIILIYSDNATYTSGRWSLNKNKKNIAVVLGAAVWSGNVPSPTLSSRVDKAIELFKKGYASKIIFTGGSAPGELTEAEVAFEYAKAKGIDTSFIETESLTSSTTEQIRWIKNNLIHEGSFVADVILISDSYHLPRIIEISKFFNLDIKVAESTHKIDFKDKLFNKLRECIALFNFWCFAI